ncbi:MAG: hypothetical protein RLZZ242_951 [Bacteroidota bacterium]
MRAYLYRIGFVLYATCIAALSLINIGEVDWLPTFFDGFDKLVHFCFYLGFSVLLAQAFLEGFIELPKRVLQFWVFGYGLLYGGLIELAQMWLTTFRQADWNDFIANTIGVLVGVVFYPWIGRILPNVKSRNN